MRSSGVPTARWARATIAHRDRRADAWAEPAGGDDADRRAVAETISVPSRAGARPSGLSRRAGGPARWPARLNPLRAGKAALDAAALLNRPGERRFDRVHGLVEFVAVEAEARLEPQRIARAKPDRRDVGLAQQQAREALPPRRGKRNLIAVLAGIARARDEGLELPRSAPAARS